ncbi:MAG: hypothetical protein CM1200mP1_00570 [Candidatus Neomarinimicrobiota bacterium]|nr:MAG: hypothetical protein CM1200mP1_00570 [Candidatus Neomarinimicrobiota bacterium]
MLIPEYLQSKDILPGIKVDTGAHPLEEGSNEKNTTGLDGLGNRLREYIVWVHVLQNGDL